MGNTSNEYLESAWRERMEEDRRQVQAEREETELATEVDTIVADELAVIRNEEVAEDNRRSESIFWGAVF